MNVGENDEANSFDFYGAQAGYTLETSLGEGHYRVLEAGSSADFLNPEGTRKEKRTAAGISFDQQLGKVVGQLFDSAGRTMRQRLTTTPSILAVSTSVAAPGGVG